MPPNHLLGIVLPVQKTGFGIDGLTIAPLTYCVVSFRYRWRLSCKWSPGKKGSSTFSVELPAQDIAYRSTYEVDHQAEGGGIAIASST